MTPNTPSFLFVWGCVVRKKNSLFCLSKSFKRQKVVSLRQPPPRNVTGDLRKLSKTSGVPSKRPSVVWLLGNVPPFAEEEKPLQENERERETRTREDLYYVVVLLPVVDDDATPARVLFPPRVVEFFCGAGKRAPTRTLHHYVSHFPQGNAEREKDDPKRNLWI